MKIPAPPLWVLGMLALFQLSIALKELTPAPLPGEVQIHAVATSPTPRASIAIEETLRPFEYSGDPGPALNVAAQAQSNPVSCGQSCVAMAVNYLTGKQLRDDDVDSKYGFALLEALKEECRPAGYTWRDAGDLDASSWTLIKSKLLVERIPVILALNGEHFSPKGRGQIVLVTGICGESVLYIDPADGLWHTTTRQLIEASESHPDGKFIFVAEAL